ncbi:hypothetical protein BDR22DRAFT_134828 [Usnea florida]
MMSGYDVCADKVDSLTGAIGDRKNPSDSKLLLRTEPECTQDLQSTGWKCLRVLFFDTSRSRYFRQVPRASRRGIRVVPHPSRAKPPDTPAHHLSPQPPLPAHHITPAAPPPRQTSIQRQVIPISPLHPYRSRSNYKVFQRCGLNHLRLLKN